MRTAERWRWNYKKCERPPRGKVAILKNLHQGIVQLIASIRKICVERGREVFFGAVNARETGNLCL